MQEKPPAVHHDKGYFSWVLPPGMWLIGLDWRVWLINVCLICTLDQGATVYQDVDSGFIFIVMDLV